MQRIFPALLLASSACLVMGAAAAQTPAAPEEKNYYRIVNIPAPEGVLLECGGVATLPDGRVAIATRRGEVWLIENATAADGSAPRFVQFASGLHEALGLAWYQGSLYTAQRGELTRLTDTNGDDRADVYETVHAWPLSAHYHEYSFGPKVAPDGSFFISTNVAFGEEEWWRGESRVPWRGWAVRIHPDGTLEPWATGLRSPAGIGMIDGEFFYSDNQGDWQGSGGIVHLTKGSFVGHPAGLNWTQMPGSPLKLTPQQILGRVDERRLKDANGRYITPQDRPEETDFALAWQIREQFPEFQLPAVVLPHGILGVSNSEILRDDTAGRFGPFAGQVFVGDQGESKIMRVVMEKVNGAWQGAAFNFRSGFESGVLRMSWAQDGSLYAGLTNRGWGSQGNANQGLQRLVWTGEIPMEMKTIRATPDGFEIEFTLPIDKSAANLIDAYGGRSFTYKYQPVYGSPTVNEEQLRIRGVKVSDDGLKVRLVVDNLRQYYVHEIRVPGVRSTTGLPVLHPFGYYTLNNIPAGDKLPVSLLSTKRAAPVRTAVAQAPSSAGDAMLADVMPLLEKHTCMACHNATKRQVGPSFTDVARRKYSDERIMELIRKPEAQNWPGYATPMPPMSQVPYMELAKIARWINSLAPATGP